MSKKGITGHDEWVVTESLATALIALEQLEPKHRPLKHMDDIRKLLVAATSGHGFIVPEDDVVAMTRKGKQVLNVDEPAEACACARLTHITP